MSTPTLRLSDFDGAAFDLDGVITRTATVHAAAWKRLFDEVLQAHAAQAGIAFQPFDLDADYRRYVDGKPRYDGVRDFLRSRGIAMPEGASDDPPDRETIRGLGNRKNRLFGALLDTMGVDVFASSVAFVRRVRAAGLKTAVVSSSENTARVLALTGLGTLFDVCVDGVESERLGLKGKPAPDTFLHAARVLGTAPARMFGVEDALAGVAAIHAAGYGAVIGIDRAAQRDALRKDGASIVVRDLDEIRVDAMPVASTDLPVVPTDDPDWLVVEEGFTLAREHEIESLFAIGNGHLGSRGSLAEGSPLSAPATYMAGVFDHVPGEGSGLAVLADWTQCTARIDGATLDMASGTTLAHRRLLDMRQGIVFRHWRQQDPVGRIVRIDGYRFASATERHVLAQSIAFSAENFGGSVTISTSLAAATTCATSGGTTIAMSADVRLLGRDAQGWQPRAWRPGTPLQVEPDAAWRLDRVVSVHASAHPSADARPTADSATAIATAHVRAWRAAWEACDIRIDGDHEVQRALRFAIYHLLSATNPVDAPRASIGARGMTGSAYKGHVFWDVESFMLPFYIHAQPATARGLLLYRYRTLPAARRRAAALGYRGAMFAWESADTGDDVTPAMIAQPDGTLVRVLTGEQEHHISADVALGTWRYWFASGDAAFLLDAGAEILVETARFWASRVVEGEDGRYHILRVIGPDEYHEAVDDNAYTNAMAAWNLRAGAAAVHHVRLHWPARWDALAAQWALHPDEPIAWRRIADALYTGFDSRTGLFEQFRGYFDLEDIDLAAYAQRDAPIDVVLGHDRVQRSQLVKQADVLMQLHHFWDDYPPAVREANFRYYEPRCAQGSSLSPAIHALLAARLGDTALASRYLRQAMDIDLADNMGNAAGGVHMAALGGLWQAVVFGFGGFHVEGGTPRLHARLPAHWRRLAMRIAWHGQVHDLAFPDTPP